MLTISFGAKMTHTNFKIGFLSSLNLCLYEILNFLLYKLKTTIWETQKSAEAGCLKIFNMAQYFFFIVYNLKIMS